MDIAERQRRYDAIAAQPWTREQYERACRAEGIDPREDRVIPDILRFNSDGPTSFNAFAAARWRGMQAEGWRMARVPAVPTAPARPSVRCRHCGAWSDEGAMFTTLGGDICDDCV